MAPKSFVPKLFLCNTILLLQSFYLMCDICIFPIFEKMTPNKGGAENLGTPIEGGKPELGLALLQILFSII